MKHIIFAVLFVVNVSTLYGLFENEEDRKNLHAWRKFLHRYGCSQEIEDQLLHEKFFYSGLTSDGQFYVKNDDVTRLVNAIRLKRLMQDKQITGIDIPKKCWSRTFNRVVALAIPHITAQELKESGRKLTLEEVQKLAKLIEETAFNDLRYPNLCLSINGILSLIDLEDNAFFAGSDSAGVTRGLSGLFGWPMEKEAKEWLTIRYKEVAKTQLATDPDDRIRNSLSCNGQYDDKDINFNNVKKWQNVGFFCPEKK